MIYIDDYLVGRGNLYEKAELAWSQLKLYYEKQYNQLRKKIDCNEKVFKRISKKKNKQAECKALNLEHLDITEQLSSIGKKLEILSDIATEYKFCPERDSTTPWSYTAEMSHDEQFQGIAKILCERFESIRTDLFKESKEEIDEKSQARESQARKERISNNIINL